MNIYKKLFELQKIVSGIKKESENPFYNSAYFDINQMLAVLKPELQKMDVLLLQPLSHVGEKPAIETMLVDIENGEKISEKTPIIELTDAQKQGGCITYFRRYALQSFFALEALDDDGNEASGKKKPKAATTKKSGSRAASFSKAFSSFSVSG